MLVLSIMRLRTRTDAGSDLEMVKSKMSNVGALRCASSVCEFAVACALSAFRTAQSELIDFGICKHCRGLALETRVCCCDILVGDCTTTQSIQHCLFGVCLCALPVNVPSKHFSALSRRLYKRGLQNVQFCSGDDTAPRVWRIILVSRSEGLQGSSARGLR